MKKSLMISIHKKHVDNIKNKLKTLELRTWLPKLNGLKGIWVYIYEPLKNGGIGAVIGRFWFDEYEEIIMAMTQVDVEQYVTIEKNYKPKNHKSDLTHYDEVPLDRLCLTILQVLDYGKGKDLYAWHIKKLEIFDEPKSLSDFYVLYGGEESLYPLKKAPQKSVGVYVNE